MSPHAAILLALLASASTGAADDPQALQQAVLELGAERDALRAEVERLRGLLAACEADVEGVLDRRDRLVDSLEREVKSLRRQRFFGRFGCTLGVGGAGWRQEVAGGVSVACGVRLWP